MEIFDEELELDLYLRIPLQCVADSDEKTEEPTAKRKQEARKKGQVFKSVELNSAIVLLAVFVCLKTFGLTLYEQIIELGTKIYEYRKEFIEKINDKIFEIHLKTTENKEEIKVKYISNIGENYLESLKKNKNSDIQKGYTQIGIHRDDFEIYINDSPGSLYGSQGQKRTTIISLKLAESNVIYDEIGERPVILLDDFMSELDKKRIQGLFENIKENQVIITCTDSFKINNTKYRLYKITNATIECI